MTEPWLDTPEGKPPDELPEVPELACTGCGAPPDERCTRGCPVAGDGDEEAPDPDYAA